MKYLIYRYKRLVDVGIEYWFENTGFPFQKKIGVLNLDTILEYIQ